MHGHLFEQFFFFPLVVLVELVNNFQWFTRLFFLLALVLVLTGILFFMSFVINHVDLDGGFFSLWVTGITAIAILFIFWFGPFITLGLFTSLAICLAAQIRSARTVKWSRLLVPLQYLLGAFRMILSLAYNEFEFVGI